MNTFSSNLQPSYAGKKHTTKPPPRIQFENQPKIAKPSEESIQLKELGPNIPIPVSKEFEHRLVDAYDPFSHDFNIDKYLSTSPPKIGNAQVQAFFTFLRQGKNNPNRLIQKLPFSSYEDFTACFQGEYLHRFEDEYRAVARFFQNKGSRIQVNFDQLKGFYHNYGGKDGDFVKLFADCQSMQIDQADSVKLARILYGDIKIITIVSYLRLLASVNNAILPNGKPNRTFIKQFLRKPKKLSNYEITTLLQTRQLLRLPLRESHERKKSKSHKSRKVKDTKRRKSERKHTQQRARDNIKDNLKRQIEVDRTGNKFIVLANPEAWKDQNLGFDQHIGLGKYNHQEDAIIALSSRNQIGQKRFLLASIDGAGGGKNPGNIAAQAIINNIYQILLNQRGFIDLWKHQNSNEVWHQIVTTLNHTHEQAKQLDSLAAISLAFIDEQNYLRLLNKGDCRGIIIRNGQQIYTTRDESHIQDLVDQQIVSLKDAQNHPQRNIITTAIGSGNWTPVQMHKKRLRKGDEIILSSDGVTDPLHGIGGDNSGILRTFNWAKNKSSSYWQIASQVRQNAFLNGQQRSGIVDNQTIIVARV